MLHQLRLALPLLLLLTLCTCDRAPENGAAAAADDLPTLRLLTFRYLAQDAELLGQFSQRYRMKVEVVTKTTEEMLESAGDGLYGADVVITPSITTATRLRDAGVLQPFYVDAFTQGDVLENVQDNEGFYAGLTRSPMVLVYNPKAIVREEAATYAGIAALPDRGIRLGLAATEASSLTALTAALVASDGEEAARTTISKLRAGASGPAGRTDTQLLDAMLAGELDAAFVSLGSAGRWIMNGNPTHYEAGGTWQLKLPAAAGSGLNSFDMTCIALTAQTQQRAAAANLINFLFLKEPQGVLSNAWFEFPTNVFATPNDNILTLGDPLRDEITAERIDKALPAAYEILGAGE